MTSHGRSRDGITSRRHGIPPRYPWERGSARFFLTKPTPRHHARCKVGQGLACWEMGPTSQWEGFRFGPARGRRRPGTTAPSSAPAHATYAAGVGPRCQGERGDIFGGQKGVGWGAVRFVGPHVSASSWMVGQRESCRYVYNSFFLWKRFLLGEHYIVFNVLCMHLEM